MKSIQRLFILTLLVIIVSCAGSKKTLNINNDNKQPLIIAHRGGANLVPENTLAGFKNAINLGVDMIEIDVHLSKDSNIIVIHDGKIDRTTDGSGEIKNMTLSEIKKYDAGSWFSESFRNERVPTLDETFNIINGKAILLIEIKDGDERYPGLEKKVVESIHKHNANGWTVVQSFNKNSILRIKKMDPSIITYYLVSSKFDDLYSSIIEKINVGEKIKKQFDGIAPRYSHLDFRKVETMHKAGFKVFTWTVDDPKDMAEMINIKVDGIITNSPDKLKEILND